MWIFSRKCENTNSSLELTLKSINQLLECEDCFVRLFLLLCTFLPENAAEVSSFSNTSSACETSCRENVFLINVFLTISISEKIRELLTRVHQFI